MSIQKTSSLEQALQNATFDHKKAYEKKLKETATNLTRLKEVIAQKQKEGQLAKL